MKIKKIMKIVFLILLVIVVILFTINRQQLKKNTLYLFNWTCYTPQSVIDEFEKKYNVRVVVDNFASNEEMFSKLLSGADGYDIIFPSQDYVSILIKLGMLDKIDKNDLENFKYISPNVKEKATYDPNFEYSIPYFMGASGVSVNNNKVSSYDKSWSIFSRKDLSGKMSMMDDMREVMGDALAYLGYSINTLDPKELKEAEDLIINEWKPNLVKFDSEGFGKSFASGDFNVVQGYAEVVYGEVPEDKWDKIDFFLPKEGGPLYIDSMCILKGAKHYDLALKFIDFILDPKIYASFLDEFAFPSSTNTDAMKYTTVKPMYNTEDLENYEIKDDLGENLSLYTEIWQRIRFSIQ